ncbi:hypothetical protein TNCV_1634641 [Trichonephila clavipes]|nr:hypothetical protein TNCV_1634641 [Trichonephila clavipes]
MEEKERWESSVLPQNWGRGNRAKSYCHLMTGVHLAFCRNEFRGLRSDTVRQRLLATTTKMKFSALNESSLSDDNGDPELASREAQEEEAYSLYHLALKGKVRERLKKLKTC